MAYIDTRPGNGRQRRTSVLDGVLPATNPATTPATTAATPAPTAQEQAFSTFYNTPLYQVPLQEGLDAVNASWAGRGSLQSGAAMKAISDYGAGHASGALSDYFGLLGQQQGIGFNAASAQTGIGQNYGSQVADSGMNFAQSQGALAQNYANNLSSLSGALTNAQGQYAQNASAIGNNALMANAGNTNGLISGVSNAFSNAAGAFAYGQYGGNNAGRSVPFYAYG